MHTTARRYLRPALCGKLSCGSREAVLWEPGSARFVADDCTDGPSAGDQAVQATGLRTCSRSVFDGSARASRRVCVSTFASAPQGGSALSWVILGTPALICFGMWVYKHDREVFAPIRNERRLQAARANGNDTATRRLPKLPKFVLVQNSGRRSLPTERRMRGSHSSTPFRMRTKVYSVARCMS